ncbi:MAG: hypothetical protein ThorAB25_20370, partial [Candidatus Thorarchaeota archaeon AB_25]
MRKPSTPDEDEIDAANIDKPVELLPKSALPYHPRVGNSLDLLVDLSVGVVLGRSDSFHRKYYTGGLG